MSKDSFAKGPVHGRRGGQPVARLDKSKVEVVHLRRLHHRPIFASSRSEIKF